MAATPPSQSPPGWYPDPGGSSQERWWDGSSWTEHLRGGAPAPAFAGAPPSTEGDRGIATLAHLSSLIALVIGFAFIGPLVIWAVKKDDPYVRAHAAEALNFTLSWTLWGIVGGILAVVVVVVTFGVGVLAVIPIAIGVAIWGLVLVILAAMKANRGEMYRYPLTIRFVS